MTNEELDEARAKEALNRLVNSGQVYCHEDIAALGARLAREGWTPPEPVPVDPDVLAFREWVKKIRSGPAVILDSDIDAGKYDSRLEGHAYLAGARMAREQEQERANPVVAFAVRVKVGVFNDLDHAKLEARKVLDIYTRKGA